MREFGRNPADREIPREYVEDDDHRRALKKAREVLGRNAMNRDDFLDLYGSQSIDRDNAYVKRIKQDRDRRENEDSSKRLNREKADILQAVIHENGPAWLGDKNIQFIRTDEYDDIGNGIDEVVGFPVERTHHHVGLSMDVTFTRDIEDKVQAVVESVRTGQLGYVKYMMTKNGRGDLVTPKFLVSTNGPMVQRLQRLWLRPQAKMDKDAFRFFMADELVWQAEALKNFAHRAGQREAAEQYDDALHYLTRSKKIIGQPTPEIAEEIKTDPSINRLKALYTHWTR